MATKSPYHQTIALWTDLYAHIIGGKYPWIFHGRDHDGSKVKRWLKTVGIGPKATNGRVQEGLDALQVAMSAYFVAVKAGEAWPFGDPAGTKHFDRDLAKWLRTDPSQKPKSAKAKSPALDALQQLRNRKEARHGQP
jgi:hypothetical protein